MAISFHDVTDYTHTHTHTHTHKITWPIFIRCRFLLSSRFHLSISTLTMATAQTQDPRELHQSWRERHGSGIDYGLIITCGRSRRHIVDWAKFRSDCFDPPSDKYGPIIGSNENIVLSKCSNQCPIIDNFFFLSFSNCFSDGSISFLFVSKMKDFLFVFES